MKKIFLSAVLTLCAISNNAIADESLVIKEVPVIDSSFPRCYFFAQGTYQEIMVMDMDYNENETGYFYFNLNGKTVKLKSTLVRVDQNELGTDRFKYKNYELVLKGIKILDNKRILHKLTITGSGKKQEFNVIQFCQKSFG